MSDKKESIGIRVSNSTNGYIGKNIISGPDVGISVEDSESIKIELNKITLPQTDKEEIINEVLKKIKEEFQIEKSKKIKLTGQKLIDSLTSIASNIISKVITNKFGI